MIKTTVGALITLKPVLQQLANIEMPAKDSFTVLRILKVIDKEYETIEAAQRILLDRYAEKDNTGNFIPDAAGGVVVKKENAEDFSKELNQLMGTEVNLNCSKLNLDLLNNLQMSPNQLLKLEDFIEE